ncbi:MAG: ribosome recycling factor [Clostridia bacterium]|nr:ribosome recycling factor [Oscillospiraceae bacterium]MBQ7032223.1 ribosome recycling factor [Clostridia bacterium]
MYTAYETRMEKVMSFLKEELGSIRAGRASASVLDRITVEYYGSESPINQVASITSPDPHMLVIQPWDASLVKEVEKAILKSELGITPTNDGKSVRLSFPALTEERRKELVKSVSKKAEDAKVGIRNIRRDALDDFKKQEKKGEITEDDLKNIEKDIQKMTDKFVTRIEDEVKAKEKEILAI